MFDTNSYLADIQYTYLFDPKYLLIGANLVADVKGQLLSKYDFGVNITPNERSCVGIRHESTSKENLQLGKFWFYVFHAASARNTYGTEATLDWQSGDTTFRFGVHHTFDEDTSAKVKVDHKGKVDALLKHRLSRTTTAAFVTGTSIKDIA